MSPSLLGMSRSAIHRCTEAAWSRLDQTGERLDVREDEVRARHRVIERDMTAIDPRDSQSKRLATGQISELRLSGMKDFAFVAAGMRDEVTKPRAVGPIAW